MEFTSELLPLGRVHLPDYRGTRVMMLPFLLEDITTLPDFLSHYELTVRELVDMAPCREGVAYLTVDEKTVGSGESHRRRGLHMDGIYHNGPGGWGGGPGGPWGCGGMLTIASRVGCRAWVQDFEGWPGPEGEAEHLRKQCLPESEVTLEAGRAYYLNGLCVHESLPQYLTTDRQFVRLSMPSSAPWFEGYTVNPKGIMPTGPILPRRAFMDQ